MRLTQSSFSGRLVVNVAISLPSLVIPNARNPVGAFALACDAPTSIVAAAASAATAASPFLIRFILTYLISCCRQPCSVGEAQTVVPPCTRFKWC